MTEPRFIQIHTLHSYTGALLNRDDSGLAKRLPYGGAMRTRISSQCLKRHWRMADDPHSIYRIDGATRAFRSRELVKEKVFDPEDRVSPEVQKAVASWLQWAIYSGNKKSKPKKLGLDAPADSKAARQTLLFGEPELTWVRREFLRLSEEAEGDPERAFSLAGEWAEKFKDNIAEVRQAAPLRAGLTAALFGRMVTSDPEANIDAPVHVAHAFTVHAEETESDYFTAVDDLKREDQDAGADTIQETELTSGLYYGYVVVDLPGLVMNTTGGRFEQRIEGDWSEGWKSVDRALAAEILHNLLYLIAEISPGAKLGSTAPYGRAELMLVEAGDRQPRSLAGAFRNPTRPNLSDAMARLTDHLTEMDRLYETGEARRAMQVWNGEIPGVAPGSLRGVAEWAREIVREGRLP